MTRAGLLALVVVSGLLVGCKSDSPQTSEAQLHKELSGPPNLRGMKERMAGKAAPPPGRKAPESAATAGAAPSGAAPGGTPPAGGGN